jgi:hypothetical protein
LEAIKLDSEPSAVTKQLSLVPEATVWTQKDDKSGENPGLERSKSPASSGGHRSNLSKQDHQQHESLRVDHRLTIQTSFSNVSEVRHQKSDVSSVHLNTIELPSPSKGKGSLFDSSKHKQALLEVKSADELASRCMSPVEQNIRSRSMSPRFQRLEKNRRILESASGRSFDYEEKSPVGFAPSQRQDFLDSHLNHVDKIVETAELLSGSPVGSTNRKRSPSCLQPAASENTSDPKAPISHELTKIPSPSTPSSKREEENIDRPEQESDRRNKERAAEVVNGSGGPDSADRPIRRDHGLAKLRKLKESRKTPIKSDAQPSPSTSTPTTPTSISNPHLSDEQRLAALDLAEKLRNRAASLKRRRKVRELRMERRSALNNSSDS